jgi:mono/diheme cytochrome c family protein
MRISGDPSGKRILNGCVGGKVPVVISRLAAVFVVLCAFAASMAVIHAAQQNSTKAPAAPAASASGAELYAKRCIACHGNDLKGNGPFPPPYRTPPDLTTLARRHGGKFPDDYVSNVLRNGVKLPAHGPAEMPVWGTDLGAPDQSDKAQVKLRIKSLTSYIKSMQVN